MITPIRGRKRKGKITFRATSNMFTDDNPDKGTETLEGARNEIKSKFTDDNPDKGTETRI